MSLFAWKQRAHARVLWVHFLRFPLILRKDSLSHARTRCRFLCVHTLRRVGSSFWENNIWSSLMHIISHWKKIASSMFHILLRMQCTYEDINCRVTIFIVNIENHYMQCTFDSHNWNIAVYELIILPPLWGTLDILSTFNMQ